MTSDGSVTIVGHDASRTGAPLLLWSSLRWAAARTDADISLLLDRGGPLLEQYRAVVEVRVLDGRLRNGIDRLADGLAAVGLSERAAATLRRSSRAWPRRSAHQEGGETVMANTLAALGTAAALAGASSRLVAHVHELDHVADRVLPGDPNRRRRLLERVDLFIAAGRPVGRMLHQRMGIAEHRVVVVDPFIDPPVVHATAAAAARRELVPGGALVVAVGATSHRKGTDRFVDLMAMLADHPVAPHGIWLGGDPGGTVAAELRSDVARAGLEGRVQILPQRDEVAALLTAADVVVSTAREDPFPLVVLEAGALGTPVVAFDAGGAAEVLRAGGSADCVFPVGDTITMCDRVATLLASPDDAERHGAGLREHVLSNHVTDQVAPALWSAILGEPQPAGTA